MDTISGGYIAADGVVNLEVDTDKIGYIILPNKTVLATTTGVLESTNTGIAGILTYYIPKTTTKLEILGSEIVGSIIYNGASRLNCSGCVDLISVISNNNNAIDAYGSSLTAKAIGDILISAYDRNVLSCYYDFSGGVNAIKGDVSTYLLYYYGISYEDIETRLVTANGGTMLIDAA